MSKDLQYQGELNLSLNGLCMNQKGEFPFSLNYNCKF